MFTVTETIGIARDRAAVFAYLADGRNRPEWDTSVISEELTSPPPIGRGSTLHTRMRVMGREVDFDWRVVEFDAPSRIALESTAGMLPASFVLEFVSNGRSTHVTAGVEGHPTGMLRLAEPLIAESVRSTLSTGLARAGALLEARSAG